LKFSAAPAAPLPVGELAAGTVAAAGFFVLLDNFIHKLWRGKSRKSMPLFPSGCPQDHVNEICQ